MFLVLFEGNGSHRDLHVLTPSVPTRRPADLGASSADMAWVLVDARKGLLTQTRRHSYSASLLGIGHVVLAVNKMDLVGYAQVVFEAIAADYRQLAAQLGISHVACIPVSADRKSVV